MRTPVQLIPATAEREAWMARQRGQEEMSFFGVALQCPPAANALKLTLKVDHEGRERFEEISVDVLGLVAPGGAFPWERVKAKTGQNGDGARKGFDYCLSPGATQGLSWGHYHARRAATPGVTVEWVIPFADFVCTYGSGEFKEHQRLQKPLLPGEVVSVALVSSYRQNRGDTVFTIEKIEAVEIAPSALRDGGGGVSYPIVPDMSKVRLDFAPSAYGRIALQREEAGR